MPKNSKRSALEKRRYNAVYNATGSAALARQARGWSETRILETYAIRVPKRPPEIRELPPDIIKRTEKKASKVRMATSSGIQLSEPTIVTRYSLRRLKLMIEHDKEYKKALTTKSLTVSEKVDIWREWGKTNALPLSVVQMARDINRETRNNRGPMYVNADYGFVIAFYMFTGNFTREQVESVYKPDPWDRDRVNYMGISPVSK